MKQALLHTDGICFGETVCRSSTAVVINPQRMRRGLRSVCVCVHSISGWLSKNCDENSRMRKISYSKLPPKVRACVNSCRNFWTINLKSSVSLAGSCETASFWHSKQASMSSKLCFVHLKKLIFCVTPVLSLRKS